MKVKGISRDIWFGLKSSFVRMAVAINGYPLRILELPETSNELGATDEKRRVWLNPNHSIVKKLPEKEAVMFLKGVFAHEDLHQLMTNFDLTKKTAEKKPVEEQNVFFMLCNIIEDSAIENFAPEFMGGHLLNALRFHVMHLYKLSLPLCESKAAVAQFVNALIQYGDGGILKGEFTFPEARSMFLKVIPLVDKAIEERSFEKRMEYMEQVFELARPLWEADFKAIRELMKALEKIGRGHRSSKGSGASKKTESKEKEKGKPTKTTKRRKVTIRKISKEEAEELAKNAVQGEIPPEGDIELLITEEKAGGKAETDENGISIQENNRTPGKEENENKSGEEPKQGEKGSENETNSEGEPNDEGEKNPGEITDEEYKLAEGDIVIISDDIKKFTQEAEIEKQKLEAVNKEPLDIPELDKTYPNVRCRNIRAALDNPDAWLQEYESILSEISGEIALLTNQLKRVFQNKADEKEYRTSGRVSLKRLSEGRVSSRIFERRKSHGNCYDIAVFLLLDISGSMRGLNIKMAMLAAIILAEVFDRLNIPIKIMGYTTNKGGEGVLQYHYVNWLNTQQERLKLLSLDSQSYNFDGYSIRYATEIFKKRPETNKLMLVVSDGTPRCSYYTSDGEGIADTKNAVRQAGKIARLIGVAIGDIDTEALHAIYGNDLLYVENVAELAHMLGKKIAVSIKGW